MLVRHNKVPDNPTVVRNSIITVNKSSSIGPEVDESCRSEKTVSIFDSSGHSEKISRSSLGEYGFLDCKSCLKIKTQRESLSKTTETMTATPGPMTTIHEADASSCASSISTKTRVRFDKIEMREYERSLSDNPSTTSGPPIGLGWRHDPSLTVVMGIDDYEVYREANARSKSELAIPARVRRDMLKDAGFSQTEIAKAVRKARKDKQRRSLSVQNQKYDPLAEKIDRVKHGLKRIVPMRKNDRHLYAYCNKQ